MSVWGRGVSVCLCMYEGHWSQVGTDCHNICPITSPRVFLQLECKVVHSSHREIASCLLQYNVFWKRLFEPVQKKTARANRGGITAYTIAYLRVCNRFTECLECGLSWRIHTARYNNDYRYTFPRPHPLRRRNYIHGHNKVLPRNISNKISVK